METRRIELQYLLEDVLGSRNVYYQPPDNMKIKYPAIIYSRSNIRNRHADNDVYMQNHMYTVTVIDNDADSEIVDRMSSLPKVRHERSYTADNLYHDVFSIYY